MAIMGFVTPPKEKLNQTRSELDLTEEAKRKTHSSLFKAKKDGDRGAKPWGHLLDAWMPPCHHSKSGDHRNSYRI
jgi:hypothetical protein